MTDSPSGRSARRTSVSSSAASALSSSICPSTCALLPLVPHQPSEYPRLLGLRLQVGVVLLDESPDVFGHVENAGPLLLVERHREASEPIEGHATLLADLQRNASRLAILQSLVLGLQAFEFGFQVFRHARSPFAGQHSPVRMAQLCAKRLAWCSGSTPVSSRCKLFTHLNGERSEW